MGIRVYGLSFFVAICLINPAQAMRCGNDLVYEGDSKSSVKAKCGTPLDKEIHEDSTPLYNQSGYQIGVSTKTIEVWTYQKSSADFRYELIFNNGVVKEIKENRS